MPRMYPVSLCSETANLVHFEGKSMHILYSSRCGYKLVGCLRAGLEMRECVFVYMGEIYPNLY